ncbi:MAG: TOBE domain-containing protein [Anaerolineae bacterium]|nr:TOBE domain-containing protein [Anaerolineae bacterium]
MRFFRNANLLPGDKRGDTVSTALGSLKLGAAAGALSDGAVLVTIRPEDIVVGDGSADRDAENALEVLVKSCVYMGTYTNFLFDVAGETWQAVVEPTHTAEPGARVRIHLPRDRVWLVPEE